MPEGSKPKREEQLPHNPNWYDKVRSRGQMSGVDQPFWANSTEPHHTYWCEFCPKCAFYKEIQLKRTMREFLNMQLPSWEPAVYGESHCILGVGYIRDAYNVEDAGTHLREDHMREGLARNLKNPFSVYVDDQEPNCETCERFCDLPIEVTMMEMDDEGNMRQVKTDMANDGHIIAYDDSGAPRKTKHKFNCPRLSARKKENWLPPVREGMYYAGKRGKGGGYRCLNWVSERLTKVKLSYQVALPNPSALKELLTEVLDKLSKLEKSIAGEHLRWNIQNKRIKDAGLEKLIRNKALMNFLIEWFDRNIFTNIIK